MKLVEKFKNVMEECSHIGMDAVNNEVGYPYVSAAKINDAVSRALTKYGIATAAESKVEDIRTVDGKVLATVSVKITLYDESGESLTICGVGSGIDAGDKSVAKAQTMATKYAWKDSLLICDASNDPDAVNGKVNYVSKPKSAVFGKAEVSF